jgi:La-related protein 7
MSVCWYDAATPHIRDARAAQRDAMADGDGELRVDEEVDATVADVVADASGASADAPNAAAASEAALAACVKQLEWYFSDNNVVTDAWLRERIAADVDGWVPLRVMCCDCPKLAKLVRATAKSKDVETAWPAVVPLAFRTVPSVVVEMNEDGTAVRRIEPLPDIDLEATQARTTVVENFKTTNADWRVEDIKDMFSAAGEVVNVRVRHPGQKPLELEKPLGLDLVVTQSSRTHALVEFASEGDAAKAVQMLDNSNDWRNGMRVKLLVKPGAKKKKIKNKPTKTEASPREDGEEGDENDNSDDPKPPKKERRQKKDYSKWASAGAFKENQTSMTIIADDPDRLPGTIEDDLARKLVVKKQPTMPAEDGSPGFTRVRTARTVDSEL